MSMSKIISANDHAAVHRWQVPIVVNKETTSLSRPEKTLTAQEIDEIKQAAQRDGYSVGLQQGLQDGQAQVALEVSKFAKLCQTLANPLDQLDDTVEQELVALAFAIARQIIRREIKIDSGHVVAAVREAIGQLPLGTRSINIYLHPDDAATVRATLSISDSHQRWGIVEDPVIARGGCRVVTESSQIDASVERRLAAAAAKLLGGLRGQDSVELDQKTVPDEVSKPIS